MSPALATPGRKGMVLVKATADSEAGLTYERGYASGGLRCLLRWDLARRDAA